VGASARPESAGEPAKPVARSPRGAKSSLSASAVKSAAQSALHQIAQEDEAQVRVERTRPWLVGHWLGRGQGDDPFPAIHRNHTPCDDLLKEWPMGDEAGSMGQRPPQGCLGPGGKAGRCLPSGSSQGPDPAADPAHDQQAGHHSLGQRGQVVDHVGRESVDVRDDLSMAPRIKKSNLPTLGQAQDQAWDHAVVDGTLG